MSKSELKIARAVTRKHGETFAKSWFAHSLGTLATVEAFGETGVMTWPEDDPDAQERYKDIEDEIIELTLTAFRPAVAEAFVKAAREILARERRR